MRQNISRCHRNFLSRQTGKGTWHFNAGDMYKGEIQTLCSIILHATPDDLKRGSENLQMSRESHFFIWSNTQKSPLLYLWSHRPPSWYSLCSLCRRRPGSHSRTGFHYPEQTIEAANLQRPETKTGEEIIFTTWRTDFKMPHQFWTLSNFYTMKCLMVSLCPRCPVIST